MATSPNAPGGISRLHAFGRTRFALLIALLVMLSVCLIVSWTTRGALENLAFRRHNAGNAGAAGQPFAVNQQPWQTAQELASMAVTAEEMQYAHQAEQLADHEVDQAFAVALREATLRQRHLVLTGRALVLSKRVVRLEKVIARDEALVQSLKAKAAAPARAVKNAAKVAASSAALQLAEAQLGLDSDELTDTKHDLARASGDYSGRIKNELAAHEAAMRKFASQQQSSAQFAVFSEKRHKTLAGRVGAWLSQRSRYALIEQARQEGESDASRLTAEYNALEAKTNAAQAAERKTGATLEQIQDHRIERQIVFIDGDRIETDQQLASVYGKWGEQVQRQHTIVLHLVVQSLELVLFIALCMILGDALLRRLMSHPSLDRRQTQTLRTILEVGIQVLGLLLIALVIFGPPRQTTTIIGLATAALTISLQDYILAFLGWFMLVGKGGIRVGDMVEINGVCGEVAQIGLMSTTLIETTGMAEKGEPTGRRISFMNSFAIRGTCFNFSSEGQWLWDEITISVPAGEDIFAIARNVEAAAIKETAESARLAEEEWKRNAHGTRLTGLSARPIVMVRPSQPGIDIGSGIDVQVRYVTHAIGRYEVRARLYRHVIELLKEKHLLPPPRPVKRAKDQPAEAGVS
jgi:small-conductance mechanosensitive channel